MLQKMHLFTHSTVKAGLPFPYISHHLLYPTKNQESLSNNSICKSFKIIYSETDNACCPHSYPTLPSTARATSAKDVVRDPRARKDLGISGRITDSAMGNAVKKPPYGNSNKNSAERL